MPLRIGIIGGTGLYSLGTSEPIELETPFGNVTLQRSKVGGREAYFLARHGSEHTVPPHKINHRGHIDALRAAHCDYILGVNNVGALDPRLKAQSLAVAHDFVDFHRAATTFYDDRAVHVDFSQPYCPTASAALSRTAKPELARVVYAGTDGPRFETPSEIARLVAAKAQVVGMTGVPEAVLARERGLCYASLCFIGNAAGRGPALQAQDIQKRMLSRRRAVLTTLDLAAKRLPAKKECRCADATRNAELTLGGR